MVRRIVIAGSTGSIGTQALEVIAANPDLFEVVGLTAGVNRKLLEQQARDFGVSELAIGVDETESLIRSVPADIVLNGITGSIGLGPTLAALESGRTLALANKESLIVGADLVRQIAKPAQIVPVDSEHSAIAQALRGGSAKEVARLVLTASGGPFRNHTLAQLDQVTPEQALVHPNWDMGLVVTTNSATLVNKALEVIEARVLFDVPYDKIDVVVHPQSIVHSMVEFIDGSTLAQASVPDMRLPIALAMNWPERVPGVVPRIDWTKAQSWEFLPLDNERFPAVSLAKQLGEAGLSYPAVFNAANEEAVAAFHELRLPFSEIVAVVSAVADEHIAEKVTTRESLRDAETWARARAQELIAQF